MSSVTLKGIYKRYAGGVTAVSDFNLDIEDKDGDEVTVRHKDNFTLTFILNHNEEEIILALDDKEYVNLLNNETVKTSLTLEGRGVAILKATIK